MTGKSIKDKVDDSFHGYLTTFKEYIQEIVLEPPFYFGRDSIHFNRVDVAMEFDEFKLAFPDSYKKYLAYYLKEYSEIQSETNVILAEKEYLREYIVVERFCKDIDFLVDHLQRILNPESETQESKDTNRPYLSVRSTKEKPLLTREQTVLFFFYLREIKLIVPSSNVSMANAIFSLTGFSEKQVQDILRTSGTPSYLLGRENKCMTKNDFKAVLSCLKDLVQYIEKDVEKNQKKTES